MMKNRPLNRLGQSRKPRQFAVSAAMACLAAALVVMVVAGMSGGAERTSAGAATTQPSYRERYSVLSERNIFLKERGRPVYTPRESTRSSSETSRPPMEVSFILTGVILEEGQIRAFVEDTTQGKVLRLAIGDAVARGRVSDIAIDGIEYDVDGRRSWVDIGKTLAGGVVTSFASTLPTTGPAGSSTAGLNPNDPNLTLEQRMRLRREAEMKRGR